MKERFAAPDTASPPARPSDWQLRFGRKSTSRINSQQNESKPELDGRPNLGNESVSEQLLRALDTKPKEQEEWSRECVDVLIGRRNAFASEPELRLRSLKKDLEDEEMVVVQEENRGHADVAAEAKEIIRVRFQLETQADAFRQAPGHRKLPKRRAERKQPRSSTRTTTPSNASARMNHTAPLRHEKSYPHNRLTHNEIDNQKTEVRPTKCASLLQQKAKQPRPTISISTGITNTNPRSRLRPPQQLPMERRQQLLQQARKARQIKTVEERTMQKLLDPVRSDNNKDDIQEQRRIDEQIERLTLENQQAAALEERLEHRKARFKSLSRLFDAWRQHVETKREQEARVVAEFHWRVMKRVMTTWKRHTQRHMQRRAAELARLKLVREQQMNEQAERFHRIKSLPTWFYRWTALVTQQREHRAAKEAAERRRAQTERLMERLQRQKAPGEEECLHDSDSPQAETDDGATSTERQEFPQEAEIKCASTSRERASTCNSATTSDRTRQHRRRVNAWPEGAETAPPDSHELPNRVPPPPHFPGETLTRAPKRVDKVYKAMEQRAVERKQRREELKRRYEELEHKKRQEQEEQRAAREAHLLQQRMEEKARARERKLAEALALHEKQERHDHMIAQRHKANQHNRRRLLFYYALLPWRKHHALNERVARNATRWHELRSVYSHWERWRDFVQICRKLRRRRERARLEEAAKYYVRSLQRRTFRGLTRYHQATEARALAVQRQTQWNTLQCTWAHWYKRLANTRSYQRRIVLEAAARMQQENLRRICVQWRKVTNEAKLRRELEREKQQLWRKVRGWLHEGE